MLSSIQLLFEIASNYIIKKPEKILFCNSAKSGFDALDEMVGTYMYTSKSMKRRRPIVLFCNMVDISAVNAFVISQQVLGKNSSTFS